ncbi:PREDICTED: hemK methyltransferase family member 1-like [Priapulus caudatus]|uniref:peptide chain release factor N(5)-glutamine methyltransferase n=1 Tax=Priapulus caudatus TaxID=37621 RepID=A0ABM1DYZ7_PRICU|nr:PREDICTED: hemK methyltransferase family member 1-like [Priapulus caudatus]
MKVEQQLRSLPKMRFLPRKVKDVLALSSRIFERQEVPEPSSSACYLLADVMGHKTVTTMNMQTIMTQKHLEQFWDFCRKRLKREPVQYIIGEWDFCDITLKMKPPVLIPRRETEELVNLVEEELNTRFPNGATVLDVGCGSGAISLALAKHRPNDRIMAVDMSLDACCLTRENAKMLNLADRVAIHHLEVEAGTIGIGGCDKFDMIISNPPYIRNDNMQQLAPEVAWYEDHHALCGGMSGMETIRKVLLFSCSALNINGSLWLEVALDQPHVLQRYVARFLPMLRFVGTYTDFSNRLRFCKLKKL